MIETVSQFIDSCLADGDSTERREHFERLALEVFAFQYETVPLYRRLCDLRRVRPGKVTSWREAPALPADALKEDLDTDGPARNCDAPPARVFLSSGTTKGSEHRSRHSISARSLSLYRRSSLGHLRSMVLPDRPGPMAVLVLGPTAATHPNSSLGHMFEWAGEELGFSPQQEREPTDADRTGEIGQAPTPAFDAAFDAEGHLDLAAAVAWLERAAAATRPVLLLCLTTTITAVFEELRDRRLQLRLPADSRIVDTGGRKGGRALSRNGLLKAAWRFLHIPAYLCVTEYGMTELLSQFYDDALHSRWAGRLEPRSKVGPAWVRSVVVDPTTLTPLPPGQRGLLRHFDLANCESVSAIQTLDVGYGIGRGFEIIGRAPEAETRGCSQLLSMISTGSQS